MHKNKWIIILSVIGTLFAGYLTYTKMILGACPVKESCPMLWGYPVCVYGLTMFAIILIASIVFELKKRTNDKVPKISIQSVSIVGVLFSLYYIFYEFSTCNGCSFTLLLPTCLYGFVMYSLILLLSR